MHTIEEVSQKMKHWNLILEEPLLSPNTHTDLRERERWGDVLYAYSSIFIIKKRSLGMAGACLISGEFLRMYHKSESGPQRLVFEKSGIHEKEYSMGCA